MWEDYVKIMYQWTLLDYAAWCMSTFSCNLDWVSFLLPSYHLCIHSHPGYVRRVAKFGVYPCLVLSVFPFLKVRFKGPVFLNVFTDYIMVSFLSFEPIPTCCMFIMRHSYIFLLHIYLLSNQFPARSANLRSYKFPQSSLSFISHKFIQKETIE